MNMENSELKTDGFRIKSGMTEREGKLVRALVAVGVALSLGLASSAGAYTSCVGGTEVTSNVYGTEGAPANCTATTCPSPARKFCKSMSENSSVLF